MTRTAPIGAAIAIAAAFSLAGTAEAQRYERALGNPDTFEQARDVDVNADGEYVTVGTRTNAAGVPSQIHVARFDPFGNRIWSRVYFGSGEENGFSIEFARNGDILVAGWTVSDAFGGTETLVMRLDPAGNVIWANAYPGTAGSDPIHQPRPGPALIEARDESIYVTSNFQGAPVAMRIRPGGALVWSFLYFDANQGTERENTFAFTDLKQDLDEFIVISGTAQIFDPQLPLPFDSMQDPMLMRIDENGVPQQVAHFNLTPNQDRDAIETGDGLDHNLESGDFVVAGRSDFAQPTGGPSIIQHMMLTDFGFNPFAATVFGAPQPNAISESGYAAVRYDDSFQEFAIAGSQNRPGGAAVLHAFDAGGAPLWRWNSADQAEFDAVVPAPSCGYLAVGRIGGFLTGGLDDIFHIKTNDLGETGCNQRVDFLDEQLDPLPIEFEVLEEPLDQFRPLELDPAEPFELEPQICFAQDCGPCIADWNGDGILDFFDVQAFLADFAAMNPAADINMDGVFDFFDVQAFLAAFAAGCP